MVVEMPDPPMVQVAAVGGIPVPVPSADIVIPPGSATSQPVDIEFLNFTDCAEVAIRVVPASGAATTTDSGVVGTQSPITVVVTIPANIATAVEVYAKSVSCPG
jgi:hypothetical protein